jgi:hypothetical protein
MRTSDLFFIVIVLVIACFGGLAMMASHTDSTKVADSFGSSTTPNVNKTAELVEKTTTQENSVMGYLLLLAAVITVIVILIGGMVLLRKSNIGGGKYRT